MLSILKYHCSLKTIFNKGKTKSNDLLRRFCPRTSVQTSRSSDLLYVECDLFLVDKNNSHSESFSQYD